MCLQRQQTPPTSERGCDGSPSEPACPRLWAFSRVICVTTVVRMRQRPHPKPDDRMPPPLNFQLEKKNVRASSASSGRNFGNREENATATVRLQVLQGSRGSGPPRQQAEQGRNSRSGFPGLGTQRRPKTVRFRPSGLHGGRRAGDPPRSEAAGGRLAPPSPSLLGASRPAGRSPSGRGPRDLTDASRLTEPPNSP